MKLELNEKEIDIIINALRFRKNMGLQLSSYEKGILTRVENSIRKQTDESAK